MSSIIETSATHYFKSHTTDVADTSYLVLPIPKLALPQLTDGTFEWGAGSATAPNLLHIIFVGTGANNAVLDGARVFGWTQLPGAGKNVSQTTTPPPASLWIPELLCEVSGVFGNIAGVAGSSLGSSYFFLDTLTVVTGNANVSEEVLSPTGDLIAHLQVDAKGAKYVQIVFDLGANATGMNALVRSY